MTNNDPEGGVTPTAENGEQKPEGDEAGAPVEAAEAGESLEERAARLERERGETYDRLLRIAAEFENYKKRSRREAEEAEARGREKLAKEILPVLDNLDRALVAAAAAEASPSLEALAQGVRLVDRQLHGALEKFEIRRFEAQGEPFDPAKHEAIQQVETIEVPAGAVARVFLRGYTIGSRLLRPAMVAVAKAPPEGGGGGGAE